MSLFRRRFSGQGAPAGHFAPPTEHVEPRISVLAYDLDELSEAHDVSLDDLLGPNRPTAPEGGVRWIDVRGLGDGTVVQRLGEHFDLHSLAVSDVMNVGQRPKVEPYAEVLYIVIRMVTLAEDDSLQWEQVSLFLIGSTVLTFQETHIDCLDPLRDRVRAGRARIRSGGPDFLTVTVLDAIVDGYFPVLEHFGNALEGLEDAILDDSCDVSLGDLYTVKRELSGFRRSTWPLRDALNHLMRDAETRIGETARLHLRDTLDHSVQVVEVTESYRELAASLVDVHLSIVGQRTNEIMRVLTVVSAVFIPLTFAAGVYGMNFNTESPFNLPELEWRYGYPVFLTSCAVAGTTLVLVFRRLGWLGSR